MGFLYIFLPYVDFERRPHFHYLSFRLLLDNGANPGIVSFEMELPIDVAQGGDMISYLREAMEKKGIDATSARMAEENSMLEDANSWLASGQYP